MTFNQILLIFHLLAMALGVGITFANIVNFRLVKSQTGDVVKGLNMQRMATYRYTDIAFVTILATGGLMLANLGGNVGVRPWFHVKMAAVLIYVLGYVAARYSMIQLQNGGDPALVKRVKLFAHVAITGAVLAVVFAVLAFGG